MDFKHLRSFVAIVDYRNFSKAADKLNIAQSSVSTHLAQLERELGTKLLYRTTKALEVTDAGWKVYKYASQILELEGHIHHTCSKNVQHILRIGASAIPATYILPGVLQQYKELFPKDCLKINQCDSKAVVEGILDNRFDVGLTDQVLSNDRLQFIPLCLNRTIIITPANEHYLKLTQKVALAEELLKEPIIAQKEGHDKSVNFFLEKMGIDRNALKIVARVNDREAVKNMVSSGMGISLISEIAAQDFIREHRLLKFGLSKYLEDNYIYLVFPDTCTSKDHAWNFIDYLKASKALP